MTKQDADELGRRALACKHWRWMPGMQASVSITLDGKGKRASVTRFMKSCGIVRNVQAGPVEKKNLIPDLDDPATMGCLLYLVREAWPDEWIDYAVPVHDGFGGWTFGVITRNAGPGQVNVTTVFASSAFPWHPSEAEALVAALEAAP